MRTVGDIEHLKSIDIDLYAVAQSHYSYVLLVIAAKPVRRRTAVKLGVCVTFLLEKPDHAVPVILVWRVCIIEFPFYPQDIRARGAGSEKYVVLADPEPLAPGVGIEIYLCVYFHVFESRDAGSALVGLYDLLHYSSPYVLHSERRHYNVHEFRRRNGTSEELRGIGIDLDLRIIIQHGSTH